MNRSWRSTKLAVQRALQELKELRLVRFVLPSHGKSVTRFRHVLDEAFGLDQARVALLAVLLLRGPQTPGELRSRTARMAEFSSPTAIQAELEILADQPEPLVRLLVRQPGQKEDRWQQLLAAETPGSASTSPEPPETQPGRTGGDGRSGDAGGDTGPVGPSELEARVDALETELAAVRAGLGEVSASLDALRQSLGE